MTEFSWMFSSSPMPLLWLRHLSVYQEHRESHPRRIFRHPQGVCHPRGNRQDLGYFALLRYHIFTICLFIKNIINVIHGGKFRGHFHVSCHAKIYLSTIKVMSTLERYDIVRAASLPSYLIPWQAHSLSWCQWPVWSETGIRWFQRRVQRRSQNC